MSRTVVVVPALNAEMTLSPVVKGLRKNVPDGYIVGINDGSTDGTGALLRSLCDRAIEFPTNRGKGAALQAGFAVARYVGVERLVEKTKPSYYESLRASSEGWHEGQHSLRPWWEYFLGITFAAYEQLDQKLGGGERPSKADRVKSGIRVMPPVFSKAELASVCPEISERTLKRVLDELRAEGKIEVAKRGRNAMWRKA